MAGCGTARSVASIATDKSDYPPGHSVTFSGGGWAPGEPVTIVLERDPRVHAAERLRAVADAAGNIVNREFAPANYDLGVRFRVTATGGVSGRRAETAFTDAAITWTGAVSTEWNLAGNWSSSTIPTAADAITIPANVASARYPVVSTAAANALSVTLASGGGTQPSLTVSANTLTVAGNFTVNAGTVTHSGGTIAVTAGAVSITGTLNESAGTLLGSVTMTVNSGGTVNVSGTGIVHMANAIGTNPTNDITIAAGGTITQSGGSVDVKVFTTTTGAPDGTYSQSAGTFKEYGSFINNGTFSATGGTVEFAASGGGAGWPATTGPTQFFNVLNTADPVFDNQPVSFSVSGNWTSNTNVDMSSKAVTVTFNGTGAQTIGGTGLTSFANVVVNKASGTITLARTETVKNGNLTVSAGTLDLAGNPMDRASSGGTLTVSNGALLKIGGTTNNFPANFNTVTLGATSTVEFYGSGSQTIEAYDYGNLTSSSSGARVFASSGTIGIAGTFTAGSNSYTTTGSTVNFKGSGTQTIPALNFNNLTSSSTGARVLASSGTVGVAGTFTPGTNSYTVSGSTVDYNGTGAQSIAAMTYNNLTVSGATSTSKTAAGAFDVTGTLTYNNTSTGSLILNNTASLRTFNVGNLVMTAGKVDAASVDVGSGYTIAGQINVAGSMTIGATGYLRASAPNNYGGVTFTGTGTVNVAAGAQYEYMITSISGTASLTMLSDWTLLDDFAPAKTILTVSNTATLDAGTFKIVSSTLANNFAINGVFKTANATGFSGAAGTAISSTNSPTITLGSASTVDYSGGAQVVTARSYANLALSTSGTKTFAAGTTTLTGNLTVNGSAAANTTTNSTTVTLTGSSNQSIAGITFFNLTQSNAAGSTITGTTTVNNTLTLTSGNITTNANTLAIGAAGTVSRTSGHVVGNLKKNVATGVTTPTFEVGDATNYTPVVVPFASVTTAGDLTVRTTAGDHANVTTSAVNATKSVNRTWTLTNSGIVFTTYGATFTFVAGDVDGGAATANFIVGKFDTGSWSYPTVGAKTATSTQISGATSFSDFQIGEQSITTLATGTDPGNTSLAPGGAATMADAFTFQTNSGTGAISAVTVTLATGTSAGVSLVEITNDAGTVVYGSVSDPASDTPAITLGTNISPTTTLTQYKIRITPKTHANMPAPAGASYALTARISAWTGAFSQAGSDAAGTTVTIDNLSPGNVTASTATAGVSQVSLTWTNPGDADLGSIIVLRRTVSAVTDTPVEGTTYTVGNTIGSSTVACVVTAPTASCTDTGLTNGTAYYYKVFARDANGNYSATGTTPTGSPATPTVTTLATGTDPGNASLAPGGAATMADAFTFQTSNGTDAITAVTVTLATGTSAGLSLVEITNDVGSVVYGSVANPGGDAPVITLTTNISATTTLTQYKIRVTPKSHVNMPAPAGASYAVTALITVWTGTNGQAGSDAAGTTVTIDNLSPGNVTASTATAGVGQVSLAWTNPGDADLGSILVLRRTVSAVTDTPVEGTTYTVGNTIGSSTVACVVTAPTSSCTDTGLTNATAYYYKIFARDANGNFATGAVPTGSPATPQSTTLATGTEPSNASIAPGGAATMADAFTFQTSGSTDAITAVTVTLATGTSGGLSLVEITNDAGTVVYGSVANPGSDTPAITLSTNITATTALTQYKIRITPKSHANMPAPAGLSYAVTARISAWTGTNGQVGSDAAGTTVTIDNLSPGNVTASTATAGLSQVALAWTNPADADLFSIVVLRRTTSVVTDTPVEGTTYTVGNTVGSSTVACVFTAPTANCTDTGLTNGTAYYYKVFARDANGNYATGVVPTGSPATPVATTLATGTDPSNASLAPGGAATMADAFTFQTASGTDAITAVTVTLAAGISAGLSLVEITNDVGSVVYGSVANPGSDTPAIALSTNITATTTLTQYKIRITPKSHVNMPAPVGASYAVTALISAWTGTNGQAGSDAAGTTVTIDNLSPGNVTASTATAGLGQVALAWTNPGDADLGSIIVLRRTTSVVTDTPVEGTTYTVGNTIGSSTVACVVTAPTASCTDTGLTNGTAYYYRIFTRDANGNYGTGVVPTGSPVTPLATTLGNGTDPSNASLAPGGAATMANAFTFQTASGTDAITAVTVTLATGTSAGLSLLEITNDAGSVVYGSVANPGSDTPAITLGTNITATTTLTQYKIRITPKTHVNMPAPVGSSYAVTALISAWTGTNGQTGSDAAGTTVTIDNLSPGNVTASTATSGLAQVSLAWTNPGDADLGSIIVLRRTTSVVTDTPVEGTTYTVGTTIGSSTVACVVTAPTATCTDTGLTNGTAYYYKIFARDANANYATGATPSGSPATPLATTLATGTDPGNTSLAPGGAATMADAFTFQTASGTDAITAVTVTLAAGTSGGLSLVEITNDAGSVVYGSVANPGSDTPAITLSTNITATTTLTQYKIRITPKTHVNMPAPVGSSYAVTALVSAWTGTNGQAGSDAAGTTVTIDNLSPGNVTASTATPGVNQVSLTWTNPGDADLGSIVVLRRTTSVVTDTPVEGTTYTVGTTIGSSTVACVVTAPTATCTDTGLTNGTAYYYKVFARDANANYATGATPSGSPATPLATTLANGTDPGNTSLAPGGAATMADAFTFQTATGTDAITAVTVTLAAGTSGGLSLVEITNDAGSVVYGSVANPGSDTPAITLSTNITATTTLTQYKIRITPKTHVNMPAPAGSSYAVTARISSWTGTNGQAGSDAAGTTVTIDNLSPGNVTASTATAGLSQVSLSWTNPGDADLGAIVVLRRTTSAVTDTPVEGTTYTVGTTIGASTVACVITAPTATCTDTGLAVGTAYYYKIFARDASANYATGVVPTGSPATPVAPLLTLTQTASPSGTQPPGTDITFTSTYTNTGTAPAQGIVITDPIPANTDFKIGSALSAPGTTGLTVTIAYSSNNGSTWTYTPVSGAGGAPAGYDRLVTNLRWTFTGALSQTGPNNTGAVSGVLRIR